MPGHSQASGRPIGKLAQALGYETCKCRDPQRRSRRRAFQRVRLNETVCCGRKGLSVIRVTTLM
jgi:hypothetical protein